LAVKTITESYNVVGSGMPRRYVEESGETCRRGDDDRSQNPYSSDSVDRQGL
jgi:hypothetical protein